MRRDLGEKPCHRGDMRKNKGGGGCEKGSGDWGDVSLRASTILVLAPWKTGEGKELATTRLRKGGQNTREKHCDQIDCPRKVKVGAEKGRRGEVEEFNSWTSGKGRCGKRVCE